MKIYYETKFQVGDIVSYKSPIDPSPILLKIVEVDSLRRFYRTTLGPSLISMRMTADSFEPKCKLVLRRKHEDI